MGTQPQPQSLQLLHSRRFLPSPQSPLSPTALLGKQQARQLETQWMLHIPSLVGDPCFHRPQTAHIHMSRVQLLDTSASRLAELWTKDRKGKDPVHFIPKSLPISETPQDMSNPKAACNQTKGTKNMGMGFRRGLCASIRFPGLESKPSTVVLLQLIAQPHSPARPQEHYSADLLPEALQQNSPWVSSARCGSQFL